jgi:deazaflavin-dependent oxidoreductase (nitroreductase family)
VRLRTVGRHTGEERIAILGYIEDGPNLVTKAMNGWADPEPAWFLNLLAHPDVSVDLVDGTRPVRGRAATVEGAVFRRQHRRDRVPERSGNPVRHRRSWDLAEVRRRGYSITSDEMTTQVDGRHPEVAKQGRSLRCPCRGRRPVVRDPERDRSRRPGRSICRRNQSRDPRRLQ